MKIRAQVPVGHTEASTQIDNTASATTSTTDPNPPTTPPAQTDVIAEANVDMVKSALRPSPVIAGTQLTYALQVNNWGPSDAHDVQITDNLPPPLTGELYCVGRVASLDTAVDRLAERRDDGRLGRP